MHYFRNIINYDGVVLFFYSRQSDIFEVLDQNTSDIVVIDSVSSENLSEKEAQKNRLCNITLIPSRIDQDVTDNCNEDNYLFSYEELMDVLHSTTDTAGSTYDQVDDTNNLVSDNLAGNKQYQT